VHAPTPPMNLIRASNAVMSVNTILVDALQCLTDNLPYGVTVETWVSVPPKDGRPRVIVRRVQAHGDEIEYFCSSNEEWVAAILAIGVLHHLPRDISDWVDKRNAETESVTSTGDINENGN